MHRIDDGDEEGSKTSGPGSLRHFGKRRKVDPEEDESTDAEQKFVAAFLKAVKKTK